MTDLSAEPPMDPDAGSPRSGSSIDKYLLAMGHEIRGPLNTIIGISSQLLDETLPPDRQDQIRQLHAAGEGLGSIINDLIDLVRVASGSLVIEPIRFDLRAMVEETAAALSPRAASRGVALRIDWRPGLPRIVIGDPGRSRQVLGNLMWHSLNSAADGELIIRIHGEVSTNGDTVVQFAIEDPAATIPAERLARLFDDYVPLEASPYRSFGITGLGLRLSVELVKLLGGTLGTESLGNQGTRIYFNLPLQSAEVAGEEADLPPIEETGRRILIVEADPSSRKRLTALVTEAQWQVEFTAAIGEVETLLTQAVEEGSPFAACAVSDYAVRPAHSELAAALKARSALASVALIMISSVGSPGEAKRLWQAGFAAYLRKPIPNDEIIEALTALKRVGADGRGPDLITRHSLAEARLARPFETDDIDAMLAGLKEGGPRVEATNKANQPEGSPPPTVQARGAETAALIRDLPPIPARHQTRPDHQPVGPDRRTTQPAQADGNRAESRDKAAPVETKPAAAVKVDKKPDGPPKASLTIPPKDPKGAAPQPAATPADARSAPRPTAADVPPNQAAATSQRVVPPAKPAEASAGASSIPVVEAKPGDAALEPLELIDLSDAESSVILIETNDRRQSQPQDDELTVINLDADKSTDHELFEPRHRPHPEEVADEEPEDRQLVGTGRAGDAHNDLIVYDEPFMPSAEGKSIPPLDLELELAHDGPIVGVESVLDPVEDLPTLAIEMDVGLERPETSFDEFVTGGNVGTPIPIVPLEGASVGSTELAVPAQAAPPPPPAARPDDSYPVISQSLIDELDTGPGYFTLHVVTTFIRESAARLAVAKAALGSEDPTSAKDALLGLKLFGKRVGAERLVAHTIRTIDLLTGNKIEGVNLTRLEAVLLEAHTTLRKGRPAGGWDEHPPASPGFLDQLSPAREGPARTLALRVAESFESEAPLSLADLREAIAAKNVEQTQRMAQNLKGMSGLLGAEALTKLCALVSADARLKRLTSAERYLDYLEIEIDRVRLAIESSRG